MKLAAFLLITISLVLGVVGAVTAYLPPLSLPDEALVGLTLNAAAGAKADPAGGAALVPMATQDDVITAELLTALREAGVERVRVKEFALGRWPEWWMFVLGCVGLLVGAVVVKGENRKLIAAAGAAQSAAGAGPDESLAAIRAEVERLRRELPGISGSDARLRAILEGLGEAQRTHVAAFIAARPVLVARLGLGGFARLMDSFAAAERQINRAWSAAADEVENEARVCLERASELLGEAEGRLRKV